MSEFSKTQVLIAAGISIVTGLFAAFGGLLKNIAPPELAGAGAGTGVAVGLASFAALLVLLLVQFCTSFLGSRRGVLAAWLGVAALAAVVFMGVAVNYQGTLAASTFPHIRSGGSDTVVMVMGTDYTPAANNYVREHPDAGPADLMAAAGTDEPTLIWTRASIIRAHTSMLRQYQILIVALSLCLFSLVSLLIAQPKKPDRGPMAPADQPPTGTRPTDPTTDR